MQPEALIQQLTSCREYFNRSSACLQEEDSTFAPMEGMLTAAQQVAHVAHTIDWFVDGAFSADGFDLDFAKFEKILADITSLEGARKWLDQAFKNLEGELRKRSSEELSQPLPEGPVMGGAPRFAVVNGVVDHTAHHRGALTAYARLRGYTPDMPYGA